MSNQKQGKILTRSEIVSECDHIRVLSKRIAFTNGCFDLLHVGHIRYLQEAASYGHVLIVGINSDESIKRYKGENRPIVQEDERAEMLAALSCVDYVVIFEEDEPRNLIGEVLPDVLVKGADWEHYVSGRDIVEENGGEVVLVDLVEGRSTTNIIDKIKEQ